MKKTISILFAFCSLFSVLSTAQNLSGTWEGVITQDEGGVAEEYTFKVFLKELEDGELRGRAFVTLEKADIYAEMLISGVSDGTYISIIEEEILREKMIDNFFWCLKSYRLKLSAGNKLRLEGRWSGDTPDGDCVPGAIQLEKSFPRV